MQLMCIQDTEIEATCSAKKSGNSTHHVDAVKVIREPFHKPLHQRSTARHHHVVVHLALNIKVALGDTIGVKQNMEQSQEDNFLITATLA